MASAMSSPTHATRSNEIIDLGPADLPTFSDHLLRLEDHCSRMRFGGSVSHGFLRTYAERVDFENTHLLGVFAYGHLRGVGELRSFGKTWCPRAEAAFTVDKPFRGQGLGTALMARTLVRARGRGVRELYLAMHPLNRAMRRIAARYGATFEDDGAELHGRIPVPHA